MVLGGLVEPRQIKRFIGLAAPPEGVKPDLDAVGDEHPFRTGGVDGIVPGLLDGASSAAGRDSVEILGVRPFQLKGRDEAIA